VQSATKNIITGERPQENPQKNTPQLVGGNTTPPPEQAGEINRLRRKRQKFSIKTKNAIKSVANE